MGRRVIGSRKEKKILDGASLAPPQIASDSQKNMSVALVLTVLTQPAPLATEAVSVQPTPPTEKAVGEAAPPTEKWISSSCSLSGCVHTNYLTGTTTAHDFKGGQVTTNHYTGDWKAHGCNSWGCGTSGGNHRTGDYWSTPHPAPGGNPTVCCMAATATSMACQKGVSLSAYCAVHPGYAGCPTAVFPRPGMPGGNPTICQLKWAQCGGNSWTGATCCEAGSVCTASSAWYSQCKPSRNYLRKIVRPLHRLNAPSPLPALRKCTSRL